MGSLRAVKLVALLEALEGSVGIHLTVSSSFVVVVVSVLESPPSRRLASKCALGHTRRASPSPTSQEFGLYGSFENMTLLMPPHPHFSQPDSESEFSPSPLRHSFSGSITISESEISHGRDSQDVLFEFTDFKGKACGGTIAEMMVSANVKDEGKPRRGNTITQNSKVAGELGGWKSRGFFGNQGGKEEDDISKEKRQEDNSQDNIYQPITPITSTFKQTSMPNKSNILSINLYLERMTSCAKWVSISLPMNELSEDIKTGRPRISQILDEEVDRSVGKTLIACQFIFSPFIAHISLLTFTCYFPWVSTVSSSSFLDQLEKNQDQAEATNGTETETDLSL
ncbi:hypothetical protein PSTT_07231, partial [Puccinia striiformis]